jgi:hypothetical protein
VEVVETLIGSRENVDVIEILLFSRSRRDPIILMSVMLVARSRFDLTRIRLHFAAYFLPLRGESD